MNDLVEELREIRARCEGLPKDSSAYAQLRIRAAQIHQLLQEEQLRATSGIAGPRGGDLDPGVLDQSAVVSHPITGEVIDVSAAVDRSELAARTEGINDPRDAPRPPAPDHAGRSPAADAYREPAAGPSDRSSTGPTPPNGHRSRTSGAAAVPPRPPAPRPAPRPLPLSAARSPWNSAPEFFAWVGALVSMGVAAHRLLKEFRR